jgi:uncharacterized protein (TIGR03437 family)
MRSRILALFGSVLLLGSVGFAQTPVVQDGGIANAAGLGHSTGIAPGSLISIFGSNLASSLSVASSATLSTSLGDVDSVTINGMPAPLMFVSEGQINAQAPWELNPGQAIVVVTRKGASSPPVAAQVSQFSPALYGFNLGTPQAVAVNPDGTVAAPAGSIPGVTSHPASAGDALIFYASGLGPVDQTPRDGVNSADALRRTTSPLQMLMGGGPAQVLFSGLSPQFAGVYQVNAVAPGGVTTGDAVGIQLMIGGVTSADMLTIALQ